MLLLRNILLRGKALKQHISGSARAKFIIVCGAFFYILSAALAIYFETSTYYIGAQLAYDPISNSTNVEYVHRDGPSAEAGLVIGDRIIAIGDPRTGESFHLIGNESLLGRHELPDMEATHLFFNSVEKIQQFLQRESFYFETSTGKKAIVNPESRRSLFSFRLDVYVVFFQSTLLFLIVTGIWAFSRSTKAANYLVIAGFSWAAHLMTAVLGLSTEFVKELAVLRGIYHLNFATALLALAGMVSFLWHFPKRLASFHFPLAMFSYVALIILNDYFELVEIPVHPTQLPIIVYFPVFMGLSTVQWIRNRSDPIERASMRWVLIAVLISALGTALLHSVPVVLGIQPFLSPMWALLLTGFVFLGLAAAILRFRLFDIERIWLKTITWLAGGLLVVAIDLAIISFFNIDQKSALPIALFVSGWVYFPVRQAVMVRIVGTREIKMNDHIGHMIASLSKATDQDEFDGRFAAFLKTVFDAQEIGGLGRTAMASGALEQNGLAIRVPNVSNTGSIQFIGKSKGRRLFSPSDLNTASSFLKLARNMDDARTRELHTLQQDRERIVRDLHDDVGGRLLSLIYASESEKTANMARETMGALKESLLVVEDAEEIDFKHAWQLMEQEALDRTSHGEIQLEVHNSFMRERLLSAREFANLRRVLRELISNISKYSAPGIAKVAAAIDGDGNLVVTSQNPFLNDGETDILSGRGLPIMRKRMAEISGEAKFSKDDQNMLFKCRFTLPFDD